MSDEYASSGFKGSLVNPSISDSMPSRERESYPPSSDYATKNYPPPGDTTSSGAARAVTQCTTRARSVSGEP
ncbi:hypothetical protein BGW80DRAFT_810905 [Lactifluus volemus]|nr:hypothetical protein BGW80DRAFT_810905 [Lactifluus volemus]